MHLKRFLDEIEKRIPLSLQEGFDNAGIQIGPFDKKADHVLLALDVTPETIQRAIQNKCSLVVSHHPVFFKPLKKIQTGSRKTEIIYQAIKNEITVYAAHTNFDIVEGGINDYLSKKLNLRVIDALEKKKENVIFKVQVFVPKTHKDLLVDKIAELGGGWIGNYSDCTFSSNGLGTFRPGKNTNPYIGTQDKRETVEEMKIETIITEDRLEDLIEGVEEAHPYEEVAMEAFRLDRPDRRNGIGRICEPDQPVKLKELLERIKRLTGQERIQFNGDPDTVIRRIAICTGSGASLMRAAKGRADVYITGDLGHHDFQYAFENGFALVDISHYNTEKFFAENFRAFFSDLDTVHFHDYNTNYISIYN